MSQTADVQPRGATEQILEEWRSELILVILRATVLLGFFAIATAAYDVISRGQGYLAVIYGGVYAILVYAAFGRLPYWARAGFFLAAIYVMALTNLYSSGLRGDARLFMLLFVIMSLVFLGQMAGWMSLGLVVATLAISGVLIQTGAMPLLNPETQISTANWMTYSVVVVAIAVVIMTGIILLERYIRRAQDREGDARRRLLDEREQLEKRVEDRTRALQASFLVSQRLATMMDPEMLIQSVANEVREAFGYYHVQIYLWDEAKEYLEMHGGTGSAGQTLVSRKHRLAKGRGLVGRAASNAQVVLAADTAATPDWVPNPLLPNTRSELAAPVMAAGQVLGVLDVQHSKVEGFSGEDIDLIQAIANQVGIAIQNARQFTQTQQQAEREAQTNLIFQKLQSAATVEDVLQIAARELGTALGADSTRIQIGVREPEVK